MRGLGLDGSGLVSTDGGCSWNSGSERLLSRSDGSGLVSTDSGCCGGLKLLLGGLLGGLIWGLYCTKLRSRSASVSGSVSGSGLGLKLIGSRGGGEPSITSKVLGVSAGRADSSCNCLINV